MKFVAVPAALLLMAVMASAPAAQDTEVVAKQEFSRLITKDALVYVSVKDIAQLRGKLDAAGLKDLMNNEQVKAFLDYIEQRAEESAPADADNPLKDMKFSEILDTVEGQVAFAVGNFDLTKVNEPDSKPPEEIFFLINAKGKADDFQKKIVDKVTAQAVEKGAKKAEESYKGTTITTYTGKEDNTFALARIGSVFAMTPSTETLKGVIKRSGEAEGETLAGNEHFRAVSASVGPDADAIFYVNLAPIVESIKKAADERAEEFGPGGQFVEPMIEGFGLGNLKAFGVGLTVKGDSVQTKGYLHAPGGLKGMLKGIFPKGAAPKVPSFAPANTHVFWTGQFDFAVVYESLLNDILGPIAEEQGMDPQMMIDQAEAMLGIDLKDDLFNNLTGQISTVSRYEGKESKGVTSFGVKDGKKFGDAFKSVMDVVAQQAPDAQFEEEEYVGGTLVTFGEEAPVAMGIKEGNVFVGPKDSVQEAMRLVGKTESTLADNATFQEMTKLLPEAYQGLNYLAKDGLVKILTDLKSGELFKNLPDNPGGNVDPADVQKEFDFTKIPDAAVLTQNLVGLIGYSERVDDGVKWSMVAKLKGH